MRGLSQRAGQSMDWLHSLVIQFGQSMDWLHNIVGCVGVVQSDGVSPASRYPVEFEQTASHRLRSSDDMQFSFSYFYFLMSEKRSMELSDAFAELDSDQSG